MQITTTDEDGMIVILFDSRWQFPELLGYMPGTIQYNALRELWLAATGSYKEEHDHDTEDTHKQGSNGTCLHIDR